ncbi:MULTISPECIES: 3-oxoacyl-ACP synthase III family protein [Microbispora]|uniref:3-oxoacyl-ACP synthase III family protein n=1 Tax=Microbispora TaxID=2005 RepID=UPI001FCA6BBB|nr:MULTISPECIES: beta-ketoacyl-ACP synthase 3 [Microbispora]GLW22648.1 3-oxoacyl-ACP synthase III [Microbispora amethystogenes]
MQRTFRLDEAPAIAGAATPLTRPVGIGATGLYVPEQVVTNDDLAETLDTSDEWITSRIGIRQRRFLTEGMATSDMGIAAARQALDRSGVDAGDLDVVIVATFTPDQPLPSTALIVAEALGARRALPLDLSQSACAGGIHAILLAAHLLQNDAFRNILVIGADAGSRLTDPLDRGTRVFFGDAAGAALLRPTASGFGLLSWHTGSALSYEVQIPAGGSRRPTSPETVDERGQFLKMNGRAVWDMATGQLPGSIRQAALRAGVGLEDVRHFLLHQANQNIINETVSSLGISADRVPTTVGRLGNTGAASMFTVLHEAMENTVRHGDLMIMAGIGAGFLWGSVCLRHFGPDPSGDAWG